MPSKKTTWAQLRVGIMAIVAMVLLGVLVFYLTSEKSFFSSNATIYTYTNATFGVAAGQPVRLNGILIGKVAKVSLSDDNTPGRIVRMDLEVAERTLASIPINSRTTIAAENLLGAKFINIKKGDSKTTIRPGGELPADDTKELEDLFQQGSSTLGVLQSIAKRVDAIVTQVELGKGSIGKMLVDEEIYNRFNTILSEGQKLVSELNTGKGTLGRLVYDETLYKDFRNMMARVDSIIAEVQEGRGSAGKFLKDPALFDEARKSISEVRALLADINAGKGTAGKLLKDEELHNRISSTLGKLEGTLDRLNSGQGTLGQLLVNPTLYESINGTTVEMQGLLKDFRANPKKFLRIKLGLF